MTACLLRVAGLPISTWLAASNDELFAELADLDRQAAEHSAVCRRLAERIGEQAIPARELGSTERAVLLDLRRRLHGGGELSAELVDEAVQQLRTLPLSAALAADVIAAAADRHAFYTVVSAAEQAAEAEQNRLRSRVWTLLVQQPLAYTAVRQASPELVEDIEFRVRAGEPWHTKRMRQRADYLWRMITRGATRATPRGLLGQLALLSIDDEGGSGSSIDLLPTAALEWTDNIHQRAGIGDPIEADEVLGLTPLHWSDGDHLCFLVRRPGEDRQLAQVRMRDTVPLRVIRHRLAAERACWQDLVSLLLPPDPTEQAQHAVAGFLRHLVDIGVVEVFRPARRELLQRWPLGGERAPLPGARSTDGYLDTFRRPIGTLSATTAAELAALLERALRVLEVIADRQSPGLTPPGISSQPRPVLELLAEGHYLEAESPPSGPHPHDWLDAGLAPADSGYGRLVSWLTDEFRSGCRSLDLDQAPQLRSAPRPLLSWPVDCLVRPLRSGTTPLAVLDRIEPAGCLDSRFAETLAELDPAGAERVEQYRRFLTEVEERGGGRFVELLVPSLVAHAANAVRRPGYTTLWTGDPHRSRYISDRFRPAEYVPMSEIRLFLRHGRLTAEAAGQLIWPVYHATRSAAGPWGQLSDLLQQASPRPRRAHWRSLSWTLPGWPERTHLPRLTVGDGALVLAPEQWRLSLGRDWPVSGPTYAKCRQLNLWRTELGLPRWISVTPEVHADPIPCDLCSVQTVALFDRLVRQHCTELMAAELLPNPEQLSVHDLGHGPAQFSVAELLLRLPLTDTPALAHRAVAAWQTDRPADSPPPNLLTAGASR
jgi:hypothetical protein